MNSADSLSAFERMEDKANRMLDTAKTEADLNPGVTPTDDLAVKYASGGSASVEDELARMKAELGMT